MDLRPVSTQHYPTLLALNEAALPHVNRIGLDELTALAEQACYFRAVTNQGDDRAVGFLLALPPGQPYQSLNYRWFARRYQGFIYIDRVVIAPAYAGRGLGRRLYTDLGRWRDDAARGAPLTCEVNLQPPNRRSLDFHRALGFVEVGQQVTENGTKRVSLLCKPC